MRELERERRSSVNWHARCNAYRSMETTAYIALPRQMALRRHMDVIANNLRSELQGGTASAEMMATVTQLR